ncbi:MAG: amidohydrolase family protein [Akkermansiaceae bacterium]|nr:amidohydrolase family protein [Verrucomicrobiales bacterium]
MLISGQHIVAVGKWDELRHAGEAIDLGESILLPGLVNAHCHLDYTDMAGLLPPQKLFTNWITLMLSTKAEWNYTEFAESWLHGAQMLLRTGTTTVGDFEAVPELLPDVWSSTPLRVISFMEMTGVRSKRTPQLLLQETLDRVESLRDERSRAGLAPHAPYSTLPELIRLTSESARERHLPVSIHVSESALEFDMFMKAQGEMFDWLRRNGRDLSDCGLGSPVQHLERLGALDENLLAVHLNYLAEGDADLLARRKVNVVHCPRSHSYFQHAHFPFDQLTAAGVNVCLGTDSLATVYKSRKDTIELSMFAEMFDFASRHPHIPPQQVLELATVNSARALGMAGQIGELTEGAFADAIVIPFGGELDKVHEAVVQHCGHVAGSMIHGQWCLMPEGAIAPEPSSQR